VPDAAARAVAYEKGEVDVLTGGSVEVFDVPRLAKLPNSCVTTKGWEMFAPVGMLILNLRNGPLANKDFRKGLMHAIDRDFSKDVVWSGYAKVATGPLNSKTKFYTDDVPKYAYDVKKAKELIAASGYKGEPLRLLSLPLRRDLDALGRADQAEPRGGRSEDSGRDLGRGGLEQEGRRVGLSISPSTTLTNTGDPALGVARQYISSNIVKGSPFVNNGGYSNPEVDRLFAEAANATAERRPGLYAQVQKILVDDLPILWLTEMEFPTLHRCNVKDLATTAIGVNDSLREARKD
jgi:peptide/nickel transport system substrate-binding protein